MAMPDRIRKIQVRLPIAENGWFFVARAIAQAKIRMTTVRIAVAMFESICWTPTLARTAVKPAKNAESNAQINQLVMRWQTPSLRQHRHQCADLLATRPAC